MKNKIILERKNGKINISQLNNEMYQSDIVDKILNYKNLDKMLANVLSENIDSNFNVVYDVNDSGDVNIIAISKL